MFINRKEKINIPMPPDEFKKILELSNNLVIKNNSKLYFVYMPGYFQYFEKHNKSAYYYSVREIVKNLNIPFIDLDEKVNKKEKNPLNLYPFNMPGHYNEEGYRKAAQTIYKFTM